MPQFVEGFSDDVTSFIDNNKPFCIMTLGLAVAVYSACNFLGRVWSAIISPEGTAAKTVTVAAGIGQETEAIKKPHVSKIAELCENVELGGGVETLTSPVMAPQLPLMHEEKFQDAFYATNAFSGYRLSSGAVLTSMPVRPANLFMSALFEGTAIDTTKPGSREDFAFTVPHEDVRAYFDKKYAETPDGIVAFSAQGKTASYPTYPLSLLTRLLGGKMPESVPPIQLEAVYGGNTYRMSYREIHDTLESQKIYTSALLPVMFYRGLKTAMMQDEIVMLPGNDFMPKLLKNMGGNVGKFLKLVGQNPLAYGFEDIKDFENLLNLTIYQIGSMVVKIEDYRIFMDGKGKIIERQPGAQDQIRLINACGIRGFHSPFTPEKYNLDIMTENYKAALKAAGSGIVVFPAVGMGVWAGDPGIYWRAFLDAVVASDDTFDMICVNPGHQSTRDGKFEGCRGGEFQYLLNEYREIVHDDPVALKKLSKIANLYQTRKDIVQLAHNLKKAYPEKSVSLFNASDPDVTLGYHVGEYVNHLGHAPTTEENYTAMGTNGLCFEGITGIHSNPSRIIQA